MGIRRTYDHRIREAIVASGDPKFFPRLHIPRSTVRTWLKEGPVRSWRWRTTSSSFEFRSLGSRSRWPSYAK